MELAHRPSTADALESSNEMIVIGFLDDDERLHGHVLNGLPIFNPLISQF